MEYIFTDLPQYIRVTSRSEFSSSVVHNGSVLLFSEDGTTLTAKLPDGSFVTVGGSGGTDVSDTTAEAANVQSGYYFYNSAGVKTEGTLTVSGGTDVSDTTATAADVLAGAVFHDSTGAVTTGTIPTVSASITSGAVVVPSGYIAASQSFPVSGGVDFSSVTAIPSSVLGGEIFIDSAGQFQEGTMPINMGDTITPSTSSQTVSSGQYLAGDVVVEGDAALVASNIVSGVSIFGVTGTASSGTTNYYKCTTVDTVNLTWTGYKAIFDAVSGTYSYEATATSGLTYSVVTPAIGKVYADGALIEAKLWNGIPTDGLIRYAPMSAAASVDELGNNLSVGGSPTFAVDSGIGCAEMTNSYIGYQNPITDLSAYTLSIWMKRLTGGALITFSGGTYGPGGNEIWINYADTGLIGIGNGAAEDADIIITGTAYTGWQHIAVVWTGSAFRLYIGGSQYGSDSEAEYGTYGSLWPYINSLQRATGVMGTGKYAAFRLYDRVLTAAEIAALAAEFTSSAL